MIRYTLEPNDPSGHHVQVSVTIEQPDPAGQVLRLPVWIPGSYLVREFARHVEHIEARSGRRDLVVRQIDKCSWQLAPTKTPVTVTLRIYAWDLSVRTAHFDETHGFFNGTSLFPAVLGREHEACQLEIQAPSDPSLANWQVVTSLRPARGVKGVARRGGFGLYEARDHDELVDHPIEMGRPQTSHFKAGGARHELAFTGVVPGLDVARITRDVAAICEAQIRLFDPQEERAAFLDCSDRYVFMTQVTGDGYGGLEHRSSTALLCSRKDLPAQGIDKAPDGYTGFLGLVSHEYFHTWHVKRIKPAAFVPYRLGEENHTRLLWLFEGFTSYYDDLMVLRAGVITLAQWMNSLADTLKAVLLQPGHLNQSLAQSSFEAWTKYYRPDENTPNHVVSYYAQGSLLALCLDMEIRQRSRGRRSLDDVMRRLWNVYGRDFYALPAEQRRGLSETAFADEVREATGLDLSDWLRERTEKPVRLDVESALEVIGLQCQPKSLAGLPSLGARLQRQGDGWLLAQVPPRGAAHLAGLSAGDQVVAIDGLRVGAAGADVLLARYRAGERVTVHVFRRDELRTFQVTLGEAPPTGFEIKSLDKPGRARLAERARWQWQAESSA